MRFQKLDSILLFLLLQTPALAIADEMISQQVTSNSIINKATNKSISINADNQQINIAKNMLTFTGHVVVVQNGLTIKADNVVITHINDKTKQIITAQGNPVYFKQEMQDEKKNITGYADKAIYNVQTNLVTLDGNAAVFQQGHQISSTTIVYDVVKQKIEAEPLENERVKTIIVPDQVKG